MPKNKIKIGASFRTMVDAANALGCNYRPNGIRRGGVKHPNDSSKMIWFPKLFKNDNWNNSISKDGETIIEQSKQNPSEHLRFTIDSGVYTRVVFAKMDAKGQYIFVGEYKLNIDESRNSNALVWERVAIII